MKREDGQGGRKSNLEQEKEDLLDKERDKLEIKPSN